MIRREGLVGAVPVLLGNDRVPHGHVIYGRHPDAHSLSVRRRIEHYHDKATKGGSRSQVSRTEEVGEHTACSRAALIGRW